MSMMINAAILLSFLLATTVAFKLVPPKKVSRVSLYNTAPQYDKHTAILETTEELAEGSVLLRINTGTTDVDYEPGHVLALEIQPHDVSNLNEKNAKDVKDNDNWMRGPYTVSRATNSSFEILLRIVGDKSREFSTAKEGTPVKFGGKFKVPILEGIQTQDTERVLLVSTGVGVGPCVGAIEKALLDKSFPQIHLVASYRTTSDVVYDEYLDKLSKENDDRFQYTRIITSESGRLSDNEKNLDIVKSSLQSAKTHYHLTGNGQMVNEWKEGLSRAGVPDDKVTLEMYFNHREEAREDTICRISDAVKMFVMQS